MNEHSFIRSVHRYLGFYNDLKCWKIADPYQGGVPDAAYFGDKSTLWVEYKHIKALPKRPTTLIDLTHQKNYLKPLQQQWLLDLACRNISVAVIVGVENNGGVIFPGLTWQTPQPVTFFKENLLHRKSVAKWIYDACCTEQ